MAAYSAVACFRQTLKQLQESGQFPELEILPLHDKVFSLQTTLDNIAFVPKRWRKNMKEMQTRIREVIYKAQDKFEYWIKGDPSDEASFQEIADDVDRVAKEAEKTAEDINNDPQSQNLFSVNQEPFKLSSKTRDTIVGQEEDFKTISETLTSEDRQRVVLPITGLPGIGKTTLARSIYDNQEIIKQFNIRSWVTISQEYNFQEIFSKILSSLESKNYQAGHYAKEGDEQTLFKHLHQELYNLKYLIVVDDVWDTNVWDRVIQALPDKENGSRILLTSRIPTVAESIQKTGYIHTMKPLSLDNSWILLCYKVFDFAEEKIAPNQKRDITKECPAHLIGTGRDIAGNCRGLPLSLTVVGGLLLQEREKIHYWKRVKEDTADTSRIPRVATSIQNPGYIHEMKPFSLDNSWIKGNSSEKPDEAAFKNDPQNSFSENPQPSKSWLRGKNNIVGQEKDCEIVTDLLVSEDKQRLVIPIIGLPGSGKTTLARSIYDRHKMIKHFNIRAWVTVSQEYNFKDIFSQILSSLESQNHKAGHYTKQGNEQTLLKYLYQNLYNLKYLIVVDDVWDTKVLDRVIQALPDKENRSRVLLTTRDSTVANDIQKSIKNIHVMRPLRDEDSWRLLCYNVFVVEKDEVPDLKKDEVPDRKKKDITEACPPHLKDTGKSIARKCKGLPLSITLVGGLLYQETQKIEYWKRVEEDVNIAASKGEKIISLSYNYLPGKLKGCFLYMGAFPEDSEIRVSKLIKLWVAEGFLTLPPPQASPPDQSLEVVARRSLEDLIGRNLISVRRRSSNGGMKVCGIHDSLRELAVNESRKERFLHSRKKYVQKQLEEDVQSQRRVSIHKNALVCLKDVYEQTKSIKYARSLLYVGPHHDHPLSFCLTFDLLRVLDAFTVYFIDFPHEFLELIHLRYLSFTYNDDIPPKISQLQKLQVLMVRRDPKIIFVGVSFLPDEIWMMPQLKHLWFTETDFPAIPPKIAENRFLLLNLQTLANVNAAFFTDKVLDNMPNLKKLAMWIDAPDKIGFSLKKLSKLKFFKFVVLNPIPGKGIVVEAEDLFPRTLKRLSLSGCGLSWEYMEFVANELKDLEVLKLREHAFYGDKWHLDYKLKKLKYLLIEYLNFKSWEADDTHFPILQCLILKHCYNLEKISLDVIYIEPLELIEMVDCSPDAVHWAEAIEQELKDWDKTTLVRVFSSWK